MVFQNPDNQLWWPTWWKRMWPLGLENLGVEPLEIQRRVKKALEHGGHAGSAQSAPHMQSADRTAHRHRRHPRHAASVLLMDEPPPCSIPPSARCDADRA
jgi:hypothetical protein